MTWYRPDCALVTHLPSGTTARCEKYKRNMTMGAMKQTALQMLRGKLVTGSPAARFVRDYDMTADTVTDLATGKVIVGAQRYLDGERD